MYDFGANWDCSKRELERKRHFEAFFPSILSLFAGVCSDHDKIIGRWITNLLSLSVEFLKKKSSCWHWALCGTAVARRRHWAGAEAKLRQHCLQMLPALLDPRTLFYHFHFLGAFSCLVPFYFPYFRGKRPSSNATFWTPKLRLKVSSFYHLHSVTTISLYCCFGGNGCINLRSLKVQNYILL